MDVAIDESRHQGVPTEVDLFRAVGRDRASFESGYVAVLHQELVAALQHPVDDVEEFKILE